MLSRAKQQQAKSLRFETEKLANMVGNLAFGEHSLAMLAKYADPEYVGNNVAAHVTMMRRWLMAHLITRCGGT